MTVRGNAQAHPFVTPIGRNGLRGMSAIEMRGRDWGGFVALRQGGGQFWWFTAPCGHEVLLDASRVRKSVRPGGKRVLCPECKRLEKSAEAAE